MNETVIVKIHVIGLNENFTQDEIIDKLEIGFEGDYKYIEYEQLEVFENE